MVDPKIQRVSRMDMAILPDPTVLGGRLLQQQKAQEMARATEDKARRHGIPVPDYEFLELIGKGSFGRVYKCRRKANSSLVAVKVMEVDREDFKLDFNSRDAQLKDITNEIKILQTLKDSNAKNVNYLHEAFAFHSQLWLVSEYCPGGSLQTLMRVRNNLGFEERYIITICRELAVALKHVHDMGIIHRDVKAANILITQDGGLQLCDFGVSGILESGSAKRSTIIGTPFWMPPEMHTAPEITEGYGTEIDCWAFGCTAYELATGQPPNARIDPSKLHLFLQKAPRLEGENYSDTLKEFVAYSLVAEPKMRPTADQILKHPYLAGTERYYPTTMLRELIERFANWERQGGQRASLFNAHGAGGPGTVASFIGADDDWNFSTTDDFEMDGTTTFITPSTPLTAKHIDENDTTPKNNAVQRSVTPLEKAKEEQRVARGGQMMERLFNPNPLTAEYSFGQQQPPSHESSDLPFRRDYLGSDEERKSIIDLDAVAAGSDVQSVDLGDVPTIKPSKVNQFYDDDGDDEDEEEADDDSRYPYWSADERNNRRTRDWKFPAATMPAAEVSRPKTIDWSMEAATAEAKTRNKSIDIIEEVDPHDLQPPRVLDPPFRPMLKHTATEPIGSFGDHLHPASAAYGYPPDRTSLIDLDEASVISRPSTAASSAGRSEISTGDPFDLSEGNAREHDEDEGLQTIRRRAERSSFHVHSQSEPTADRTSQGELIGNHVRDLSNVTDSEFEKHFSYSVRGTADSLRRDSEADDADEEWESANEPVPQPMITNALRQDRSWANLYGHRSFSQDTSNNDWGSYSDTASRDEGITLSTKRVLRSDTSSERAQPINRSTTQVNGNSHNKEAARALISKFPDPMGPSLASLEEDAEPRIVAAEFERLLTEFMTGLSITGALMKDGNAAHEDGTNSEDTDYSSIR